MTQEKEPLLLKYHRDVVESLDRAIFCCEMLAVMIEFRKPSLSLDFANSVKELIAIRDGLAEMKESL